MPDFRCKKCHNLLFKYRLVGNKVEVEVKCYKDNEFNTFTVYLPITNKKDEKM